VNRHYFFLVLLSYLGHLCLPPHLDQLGMELRIGGACRVPQGVKFGVSLLSIGRWRSSSARTIFHAWGGRPFTKRGRKA